MLHSTSEESLKFSASQEIPRIRWNPQVHYSVRNNPPLEPIVSQINRVLASPPRILHLADPF